MYKKKRNQFDKLKTLLFGKDLRVGEGEVYKKVRKYDFSSYYPEENYIRRQSKPGKSSKSPVFDIRDYGADTDSADNCKAINTAISEASRVGGTVLVDGGDFVSTTVIMKSNVTLFIAENSSITANETGKGYKPHKALLYCENSENIKLTGGGKLKGNGHLFGFEPVAPENATAPAPFIDVVEMRRDYRSQLRFAHPSKYGGPVYFENCKNIEVDNFIIENSAYWTFKLSNCENVSIKNFVINNNRNVANADGIDLAGTSNVTVSHCFISTADDGIVIKNASWLGNVKDMKNIKITDCEIISRTNAIKVGTETTHDISDIDISDCRLFMTDLYPGSVSGISLEACDGTVLDRVFIKNIEMNRCTCPIFIRLGNRNRASRVNSQSANAVEFGEKASKGGTEKKAAFNMRSEIKNITIDGVKAFGVEIPIIITGFRQHSTVKRVKNVTLKNICLDYAAIEETVDKRLFIPEYAKEYPEGWRFRNLPAYALWARHIENLRLENFTCTHALSTWKKDIVIQDAVTD